MKVKAAEPEGFAEFWQCWMPHRRHTDSRAEARNTYRKHILAGAEPADILDGARGFFFFMKEKDKPYVPLAATWLNREAYLDWAEELRKWEADREAQKAAIEAKRAATPPKPIEQPEQSEDRAAIARRVFEQHGLRPPGLH